MITFILSVVLGFPILVALLTYTLYCYEETNRTGQPLQLYLSIALRTALRSIASEILIILLHPVGLWPRLWAMPSRQAGKGIVVLVHGLFHNQSAWIVHRRWLHARGYATACFAYPSWRTDWSQTELALKRFLREVSAAHPNVDVHLIGHSLGGLLLRAALADTDTARRVRTLTTLGTPFHGSKLSPFALNSLGRYLRHNGDKIREIESMPFPLHVKGLAVISPADNMVLPNSALRCSTAGWTEHETAPVSHVAMLHSRDVFRAALTWIKTHGRADAER